MELLAQTAQATPRVIDKVNAVIASKNLNQPEEVKMETDNGKGPVVPSVEMIEIEEAKKKQQRTMIIVAVVVIALSIGAVWFFTRKKKA